MPPTPELFATSSCELTKAEHIGQMDDVDKFDIVCEQCLYVFGSIYICCVYSESLRVGQNALVSSKVV